MEPTYASNGQNQPGPRNRRKLWVRAVLALVVLILLGIIGWLAWQLKLCQDEHSKVNTQKQQLQTQVNDLTKQLAEAKKSSGGTTPAACSEQVAISTELKDNIAAAISSKNTAALEGYMASAVNVVFAASEKGGDVTPAQAVTDLDYLDAATSPWDFSLPAATLASYQDGDYQQYFEGVTYVGKSANNYVVSFGFDMCGKINRIFVSVSDDLL